MTLGKFCNSQSEANKMTSHSYLFEGTPKTFENVKIYFGKSNNGTDSAKAKLKDFSYKVYL